MSDYDKGLLAFVLLLGGLLYAVYLDSSANERMAKAGFSPTVVYGKSEVYWKKACAPVEDKEVKAF